MVSNSSNISSIPANIYKAQRAIFGSNEQPVIASIPSTYHIGVEVASFLSNIHLANAMMCNNNVANIKNNNLSPLMNPQQPLNNAPEIPMNMTQTLTHLLEAAQSQLNAQQLMQMPVMPNDRAFLPVGQTSMSPFNDMRDSCKFPYCISYIMSVNHKRGQKFSTTAIGGIAMKRFDLFIE